MKMFIEMDHEVSNLIRGFIHWYSLSLKRLMEICGPSFPVRGSRSLSRCSLEPWPLSEFLLFSGCSGINCTAMSSPLNLWAEISFSCQELFLSGILMHHHKTKFAVFVLPCRTQLSGLFRCCVVRLFLASHLTHYQPDCAFSRVPPAQTSGFPCWGDALHCVSWKYTVSTLCTCLPHLVDV